MGYVADNSTQTSGNSNFEKAAAFVNIYVPTKGGQRKKLGAIPLKESVALHKQIIGKVDDEDAMKKLVDMLEFEFHAVSNEADELDI